MKKTLIETPLFNYERKPIITIACWLLAIALCYWVYDSIFNQNDLRTIHPLSFFSTVPAAIALYQALWFTVTPMAVFFKDRIEVKKSIFQNKQWHFLDIKQVNPLKGNGFSITYNDDENEFINLSGIRSSHLSPLRDSLRECVEKARTTTP